jgi:hypothetical protein
MSVQGRECGIVLKAADQEAGLPYSGETIRERAALLVEEAAIEGDRNCGAIRQSRGVTGCVVTPLTLELTPLLMAVVLGQTGKPEYVSGTRNLYSSELRLVPFEDSLRFELRQSRGDTERRYALCGVLGFELRIAKGEAVKLRLDVSGSYSGVSVPVLERRDITIGERFKEDGVEYALNGKRLAGVYGLTIQAKKARGGTRTEVWIHRVLDGSGDLPMAIDTLVITARLFRDTYEDKRHGLFRLRLSSLALMADETELDSAGAVVGPLRYYCADSFTAEVFEERDER